VYFYCVKYQVAQILKQPKASHYSIVNISSIAGLLAVRLNSPYAAVKHGVIGLTKSAAVEYSRSGIRLNSICPGYIATPMFHDNVTDPANEKRRLGSVPMGRLGTPDEVASACLWLLSDKSSFTTGFALSVDGGLSSL